MVCYLISPMDTNALNYEIGSIVQHDDGNDYIVYQDEKGNNIWQLFKNCSESSDSDDELEIVQGFYEEEVPKKYVKLERPKKTIKHKLVDLDTIIDTIVEKKPRGRPPKVLDKPKRIRAATDYNIFVKEHLPTVNKENPELDRKAKMQLVGKMWKKYKESK